MFTVLIVDDEADIRVSLEQLLEAKLPVRCRSAAGGRDALAMLEADGDVDLVVTDYKMPDMDGLELLAALQGRRPGMPVFLLTAFPDAQLANKVHHQGGRFFPKPADLDELLQAVGDVMQAATAR